MITLREPIQLKNKTVTSLGDSFGDRIRENYKQISVSIEPDDLLHIVTRPAEVFYAEGDQTSIFNRNIRVENVNEEKIQIVNQLINRILVSGQANFTYQDRIYISTILRKLGITDEKRFMKYVSQMMTESQNQTRELRELTSRVDTLRERIPEVMESIRKRSEDVSAEVLPDQTNLYLAETIFNRLQTDRVYDTVWNFTSNAWNEQNITKKELSISEQKKSSTYIKLNNLALSIVGGPVDMVHASTNLMEGPQIENITNLSEEEVKSQLVESSLFSLIQQVYESRQTQINEGMSSNLNTTQAMFESAGNIFVRFVENIVAPIVERSTTRQDGEPIVRQVLQFLEEQVVSENIDASVTSTLNVTRTEMGRDDGRSSFTRYEDHTRERVVESLVTEQTEQPVLNQELHYLQEQTTEEHLEETIASKIEQVNQQNVENVNQYLRVMQQLRERTMQRDVADRRTPARGIRESLDALDDPMPLLLKYREEQEEALSKEQEKKNLVIEAYPEKVRPLLQFIDGIMSGQNAGAGADTHAEDALSALTADIAQIEMQHREVAPTIIEKDPMQTVLVEQLVEQIKGQPQVKKVQETASRISQIDRNIQLIHKATETINEEEILERIDELRNETRESRTVTSTENDEIVTSVNRVSHEEHIVNETISDTEITELVRQHVISQMGDLSDQVYARIEKKLQNEKIRRGF